LKLWDSSAAGTPLDAGERPEASEGPSERQRMFSYLGLALGIIGLGFSAIFVTWAAAPGAVSSLYRMAIAIALLAVPALRRLRARRPLPTACVRYAVLAGVFFALDLGLWASGVIISGATDPTLLANTAPVWVGLGALFIYRRKLGRGFWLGLAVALAGSGAVLGIDALRSIVLGSGSLLGLTAGVFYGAYILATEHGRKGLDSLSYFWISGLVSTMVLLAYVFMAGLPLVGYPPRSYLNFLAMGVVAQTISYLAINYALGYLPATVASPTLLIQPVLTALLAGPLLGERVSVGQAVAGMVVLVGIFIVHRSHQPPSRLP
jgi:drug/metabolite transporter (DMT)-like permease